METLLQDVRYGWRTLCRKPGFTAVAIITLALGIGANTAIFSLVDAVVLRRLPVREPQQLVRLELLHADGRDADGFPVPLFEELQRQNDAVAGLAGVDGTLFDASIDGKPELVEGHFVSGNFFSMLGVSAELGRMLTPEDDHLSDQSTAAVITDEYWKTKFDRDPSVIGKTIYLDRLPFTIVGVTARGFFGVPEEKSSKISIPMAMHARLALKDHTTLGLFARLKPDISEAAASARLTGLVQQIAASKPSLRVPADQRDELTEKVEFIPAGSGGSREFSLSLRILTAVVAALLLLACVNLANLLLARSTDRRYEIATRLAIGAGRGRLVRQLLTESLLLASLGGALGFLLSFWTADLLPRLLSYDDVPIRLSLHVFLFTVAATIAAGIFFGIAPALRGTRVDMISALKRTTQAGALSRSRLRHVLIVAQVSLSFALLVSAGLFLRTLQKLNSVDTGFSRQHVLLASMYPTLLGYAGEKELNLYRAVLDQVRTLPSVDAASISRFAMLRGYWGRDVVPASEGGRKQAVQVSCNVISPGFFRTMGIPLLLGGDFSGAESGISGKVAIISESFARKLFAGANPIGQTFRFSDQDGPVSVVGVVKDVRNANLRGSDRNHRAEASYIPAAQAPPEFLGQATLEIRTSGDPAAISQEVRQRVQTVDKDLTFRAVNTQADLIDDSLSEERTLASLTGAFGIVALLLAAIGLFGVTAYSVAQRTREIGIRMALGAQRTTIVSSIFREAMMLVIAGLGIGAVVAVIAARLIATQLFGVAPTDFATIGTALLLMVAVAGAASLVPARRASKVDPMVALRYE